MLKFSRTLSGFTLFGIAEMPRCTKWRNKICKIMFYSILRETAGQLKHIPAHIPAQVSSYTSPQVSPPVDLTLDCLLANSEQLRMSFYLEIRGDHKQSVLYHFSCRIQTSHFAANINGIRPAKNHICTVQRNF